MRRFTGSVSPTSRLPPTSTSPLSALEQARDHRHGRRLAGAVGTEQPEQLAAGDGKRHIVHRDERAERLAADSLTLSMVRRSVIMEPEARRPQARFRRAAVFAGRTAGSAPVNESSIYVSI